MSQLSTSYEISSNYSIPSSIHRPQNHLDTVATPVRDKHGRRTSPSRTTAKSHSTHSNSYHHSDTKENGRPHQQIVQLQSKLNQLRAARLKTESLHRQDQLKLEREMATIKNGLQQTLIQLEASEEENQKLKNVLRDIAAQQQQHKSQRNPFKTNLT